MLDRVQTVEGAPYINLRKADNSICRLLSDNPNNVRPLSNTDIIEQLATARNEAYERIIKELLSEGKVDMGLDEPPKKKQRQVPASMPLTTEIMAPNIGDHAACTVKVLLTKPASSLWIELSPSNIEYLRGVVKHQRVHCEVQGRGNDKQDEEKRVSSVKGVSFSYTRSAWRATKLKDGKANTKYSPVNEQTDETTSREAAESWMSN